MASHEDTAYWVFLVGVFSIPTTTSPTLVATSLPSDLVVAYIVEDALWLWKQNSAQLLIQRQHIFDPQLSDDGQWLTFQQEYISLKENVHSEEVWAIRLDGSELHRLLGIDDLISLVDEEAPHLIYDIGWNVVSKFPSTQIVTCEIPCPAATSICSCCADDAEVWVNIMDGRGARSVFEGKP